MSTVRTGSIKPNGCPEACAPHRGEVAQRLREGHQS